jgi:nucleotide-binding universal stress UspA family protein
MASLERILVPTDFSPCSHAALGYAVFLASRTGGTVEVLHVIEPVESIDASTTTVVDPQGKPQALAALQRARSEEQMRRFVTDVPGAKGVEIHPRIEEGHSSEVLVRIANDELFDLVVIGTHGRTGLKRLVVGSVAEKVIREAACPVMTVRVADAR